MGDAVLNTITELRKSVEDALTAAGIKAADYTVSNITPPVAFVIPAQPYLSTPTDSNPFGEPYSVNLQILIVGSKGNDKSAAERIDQTIEGVISALDEDWDITEVGAPTEVTLKQNTYMGALVTLSINTSLKEVI